MALLTVSKAFASTLRLFSSFLYLASLERRVWWRLEQEKAAQHLDRKG